MENFNTVTNTSTMDASLSTTIPQIDSDKSSSSDEDDGNSPHFLGLFIFNIIIILCVYLPISIYYLRQLCYHRHHTVLVKRYVKLTFHQIAVLLGLFVMASIFTFLYVINAAIPMIIWIFLGSIDILLSFCLFWIVTWRFWYVFMYMHISFSFFGNLFLTLYDVR